jgi:hypothetical protein
MFLLQQTLYRRIYCCANYFLKNNLIQVKVTLSVAFEAKRKRRPKVLPSVEPCRNMFGLPKTDQLVASPVLSAIKTQSSKKRIPLTNELAIRVDVLKLPLFSLMDVVVHAAAGLVQFSIAATQLVCKRKVARVTLLEANSHVATAAKSLAAAIIVPLPALVSPRFAITGYRWLALPPKSGFMSKINHLLEDRIKALSLVGNVILLGACYSLSTRPKVENIGWSFFVPFLVGVIFASQPLSYQVIRWKRHSERLEGLLRQARAVNT